MEWPDLQYNGQEKTAAEVTAQQNARTAPLREGRDYTISYSSNTNATACDGGSGLYL